MIKTSIFSKLNTEENNYIIIIIIIIIIIALIVWTLPVLEYLYAILGATLCFLLLVKNL
jgi:Flp pilus assembly protein TadB